MKRLLGLGAALSMLSPAAAALAAPVLSIDADTTLAGVQASRVVTVGNVFEVDLLISDVSAASPLQSFQIMLSMTGGSLAALDALDGSFLEPPVFTLQEVLGATSIQFAQISADPTGASGAGVLARFQFQALAPGVTSLGLPTALLSAPFGVPIAVGEIRGARIEAAIPEPTAALLFALGLLIARGRLRVSAR
jgi:hypothetical protein